ncbi:MAG TPA: ABC transporter transmembrane domain-containing protein, partial [Puia sp.]|nr:ABC transporter transmembrane domain-containing protein [Puia sp.]
MSQKNQPTTKPGDAAPPTEKGAGPGSNAPASTRPAAVAGPGGKPGKPGGKPKGPSLFALLKPYRGLIILLVLLSFISNGINLWIPKIIAEGIDSFTGARLDTHYIIWKFLAAAIGVFIFTWGTTFLQTYASERVARDLRTRLADRISRQNYTFLQKTNPSQLLTNLTADVDSIKMFVSQAVVSIFSSIFVIIGASILLLFIQWQLALAVIAIIPIIGITFYVVLKKVRALFKTSRE